MKFFYEDLIPDGEKDLFGVSKDVENPEEENEDSNKEAEEGHGQNKELRQKIIDFFVSSPQPNDDDVHGFAQDQGMDEHEFEEEIYKILGDFFAFGSSANNKNANYDSEQLKKGVKIEMEHTRSPLIAKKIAKDHLTEIPDYYDRLEKMEQEAKGSKSSNQLDNQYMNQKDNEEEI